MAVLRDADHLNLNPPPLQRQVEVEALEALWLLGGVVIVERLVEAESSEVLPQVGPSLTCEHRYHLLSMLAIPSIQVSIV